MGTNTQLPGSAAGASDDIGLPGYRDFVLIARSESSEVYRAQQQGVERPVAIKVLLLDDPDAVSRFRRELEITVTLGRRHPNIVNVIDVGTTAAQRPCIIMEYYELGSLQDRLRTRGPLPWEDVLTAGTVVADALSFAHSHGLLHRDIKPANILCLPTSYVLADFGIARPIDAIHTSSMEWISIRHASPQAIDGNQPTAADDIWSVGSTLFTLLDGRPPFAAEPGDDDSPLAYMRRVRTERPRPLRRSDVPAAFAAVIDRCLNPDPAQRYPDAAALLAALQDLAAEARAWAPTMAATVTTTETPRADGLFADGPREVTIAAEPPRVVPVALAATQVVPPPSPGNPVADPPGDRVARDEDTGATVAGVMSPAAMANLIASIAGDSGYAAEPTSDRTAATVGPRSPAPRRSRRTGRLVAFAVAGLLAGGLVGLLGTVAVRMAREAAAPEATPVSLPAGPDVTNPRLAPTNVEVTQTGTGVVVRWRDQTGGVASFYVLDLERGIALDPPLPPGTTQAVISRDELGSADPPYCFQVAAVVGHGDGQFESGISATACSTPR